MTNNPYKALAERLDALPNGFPPTEDGVELRLLAHIFTPEEAALAAQLRLTLETPVQIANRLGYDAATLRRQLKEMTRRGLITAGRTDEGLGYGLMPFAVGIYEMQVQTIDAEFARLFEDYYHQAFGTMLGITPQIHRVVPVEQSVRGGYGSAAFRKRRRHRGTGQSVGRDGLPVPQTTGAHRPAMQASCGRVYGLQRHPRRVRSINDGARPDPRRCDGHVAPRRRCGIGPLGEQQSAGIVVHLQLLHVCVRHLAGIGRSGTGERDCAVGVRQPGG